MKVIVNPSLSERGYGLTSFASWKDPEMLEALQKLFWIQPNEKITQVEVDNEGIQVRIQNLYTTPKTREIVT